MTRGIFVAAMFAALALAGCKPEERQQAKGEAREAANRAAEGARQAAGKAQETVGRAVDTVGHEVGDKTEAAARAVDEKLGKVTENLDQERATFTDKASERLRMLDAEITDLQARARPRADHASEVAIAKLHQLRNDASVALDRARQSTQEAWETVKPSVEAAFARAEAARDEAKAAFGPASATSGH